MLLVLPGSVSDVMVRCKVKCRTLKLTQQAEIILGVLQLVKADVCLDGNTGPGVPQVGVVAVHNGESFTFGLPREFGHRLCYICIS